MSKTRRQTQGARRSGKGSKPAEVSSQSSSLSGRPGDLAARIRGEETARGWRGWLKEQPNPHATRPDPAHADLVIADSALAEPLVVTDVTPEPAEKPTKIALFHEDEGKNAHPFHTGVENDSTKIGKEEVMQTAKEDNSIVENNIAAKVDLRDTPSAKVSSLKDAVKSSSEDGMASLFGPAIEDDVKGVRSQIRELIQCEMQGELGQRFSRNLRIVIRREIAAAIDDQFDRV